MAKIPGKTQVGVQLDAAVEAALTRAATTFKLQGIRSRAHLAEIIIAKYLPVWVAEQGGEQDDDAGEAYASEEELKDVHDHLAKEKRGSRRGPVPKVGGKQRR